MPKIKILLTNLGYCTDMNGSLVQLFRYGYRYLFCPVKVEQGVLHHLSQLIRQEKPDICCLVEIDPFQIQTLKNKAYPYCDFSNKYGLKSRLRRSKWFRNNANGFLCRKKPSFCAHFLRNGVKKLVYEIKITPKTSLFLVHLSLRLRVRQRQIKELAKLTENKNAIVAGDFNVFNGTQELAPLLARLKLISQPTDLTFPAYRPRYSLDLFLCSEKIKVKKLRVLDQHFADHLPVILEISA